MFGYNLCGVVSMEKNEQIESWKTSPPTAEYLRSLTWEEYKAELGRQLQIARRRVEGVCVVCGKTFTGTTKRKFCSHRCAAADSRRRLAQAKKQGQAAESD